MTEHFIGEFAAAKVTSEHGRLVDVENAPFKRVWDHDVKISVNGLNEQAVIIMLNESFLLSLRQRLISKQKASL